MPRIVASMASVSTDFNPVEPGVHRYEVESVEENTDPDSNRTHYIIKNKIVEVVEPGKEEDLGRTVTDRIHIHLKTGEINEFGLAQLKRYFEVCISDDAANDPEADTDWLIGKQFLGQTTLRAYKSKDSLTGEEETRKSNEISRFAPF